MITNRDPKVTRHRTLPHMQVRFLCLQLGTYLFVIVLVCKCVHCGQIFWGSRVHCTEWHIFATVSDPLFLIIALQFWWTTYMYIYHRIAETRHLLWLLASQSETYFWQLLSQYWTSSLHSTQPLKQSVCVCTAFKSHLRHTNTASTKTTKNLPSHFKSIAEKLEKFLPRVEASEALVTSLPCVLGWFRPRTQQSKDHAEHLSDGTLQI
jgi:hypothetical protein